VSGLTACFPGFVHAFCPCDGPRTSLIAPVSSRHIYRTRTLDRERASQPVNGPKKASLMHDPEAHCLSRKSSGSYGRKPRKRLQLVRRSTRIYQCDATWRPLRQDGTDFQCLQAPCDFPQEAVYAVGVVRKKQLSTCANNFSETTDDIANEPHTFATSNTVGNISHHLLRHV
jgi:hypothetical protein